MNHTTIVHMIGSAHIDPVWLWKWSAGAIEVLSTCRTAVDLLERHPSFIFTRSDVWVHEIVERFDPSLFGRIKALVAEGRWYPAGGWYVQPDCNLPLAASYRKHAEVGKRYFGTRFGIGIDVGYNVDSFGHNASLPDLLVESGYNSYVMMRPMAHEKALPAELFRWRGAAGSEVTVWRIQGSYNAETIESLERNIEAAIAGGVSGVEHVMCFYGVGDHGGGPTEELIEWIETHTDYREGIRLEFSHPRRFFDAVSDDTHRLALVEGELQMHAIGCYTVVAGLKQALRRAEYSLMRAERASLLRSRSAASRESDIERAWRTTLFNEFHDTLGGSSIAEACVEAREELGGAAATADQITTENCIDFLCTLEPDALQRVVAFSFGEHPYIGPIIHEPWLHPSGFSTTFSGALLDPGGNQIEYQIIRQSAILGPQRALLFEDTVPSGSPRLYRLDTRTIPKSIETDLGATEIGIYGDRVRIESGQLGRSALARLFDPSDSAVPTTLCSIAVIEDPSDTWSHRIDRYAGTELGRFEVTGAAVEESGPIRATVRVEASFGSSRLVVRFRLYRGRAMIDAEFDLVWSERFAVAKLIVPDPQPGTRRTDGIPIGSIEREQDGKEYPFIGWTRLESGLGIVSPDCFGFDGDDGVVRFTLLRSPVYAWHDPTPLGELGAYRYTDQESRRFRFRFLRDSRDESLAEHVERLHLPPMVFDWTKGMQ